MEKTAEEKAYDKINGILSDKLENISLLECFREELLEQKRQLQQKFKAIRSTIPLKLESLTNDVKDASKQLSSFTLEYNTLQNEVIKTELSESSIYEQLMKYKNKMNDLQKGLVYLQTLKYIEHISIECRSLQHDDEKRLDNYKLLCNLYLAISDSHCFHLLEFLTSVIVYWHKEINGKLANDFRKILKQLKWPFVTTGSTSSEPPSADLKPEFQRLTKMLFAIELPEKIRLSLITSVADNFMQHISIPTTLLLEPLNIRFAYHFMTKKSTNRLDKPEWVFLQLLKWAKDHETFIDEWFEPIASEILEKRTIPLKLEFVSGFVKMAVQKIRQNLMSLLRNDTLFSHTVDETLSFHKALIEQYDYPAALPSILNVLAEPEIFKKWIDMERKYAKERMDDMLSANTAWDVITENKHKITECADMFITLLSAMNERYSFLPQPGHRLQFLDIQLELIDELRLRLIQLLHDERNNPLHSKLPSILNSIHYVTDVLTEWGSRTHFVILHHYKLKSDPEIAAKNTTSIFDDQVFLLGRIIDDLTNELCETVITEVKAKSRPYCRDRWYAMPDQTVVLLPTLTPSACSMLQVLHTCLHRLHTDIAEQLFNSCLETIATQVTKMIIEDVILENRFNKGGSQQLKFDVMKCLLPLFTQYNKSSATFFAPLVEACILLMEDGDSSTLPFEVHHLEKAKAIRIIERRTEWHSMPVVD